MAREPLIDQRRSRAAAYRNGNVGALPANGREAHIANV
jgi:hypothetical protein